MLMFPTNKGLRYDPPWHLQYIFPLIRYLEYVPIVDALRQKIPIYVSRRDLQVQFPDRVGRIGFRQETQHVDYSHFFDIKSKLVIAFPLCFGIVDKTRPDPNILQPRPDYRGPRECLALSRCCGAPVLFVRSLNSSLGA